MDKANTAKIRNIIYLGTELENITGFKWSKLSDSTRRFTNLVENINDIIYINDLIEVEDDNELEIFDKDKVLGVFGSTYSCCERKLQAAVNNDYKSDKNIFIKYAPCVRCAPAIFREEGDNHI